MKTLTDYERALKRLAWRLQYRERRRAGRERGYYEEMPSPAYRMEESAVTKLDVAEQLAQLPPSGRRVIVGLYLRDRTEAELARELHISQQAVNKWKQKMLNRLSQKASSWN